MNARKKELETLISSYEDIYKSQIELVLQLNRKEGSLFHPPLPQKKEALMTEKEREAWEQTKKSWDEDRIYCVSKYLCLNWLKNLLTDSKITDVNLISFGRSVAPESINQPGVTLTAYNIDDKNISRKHFALLYMKGYDKNNCHIEKCYFFDIGSKNGSLFHMESEQFPNSSERDFEMLKEAMTQDENYQFLPSRAIEEDIVKQSVDLYEGHNAIVIQLNNTKKEIKNLDVITPPGCMLFYPIPVKGNFSAKIFLEKKNEKTHEKEIYYEKIWCQVSMDFSKFIADCKIAPLDFHKQGKYEVISSDSDQKEFKEKPKLSQISEDYPSLLSSHSFMASSFIYDSKQESILSSGLDKYCKDILLNQPVFAEELMKQERFLQKLIKSEKKSSGEIHSYFSKLLLAFCGKVSEEITMACKKISNQSQFNPKNWIEKLKKIGVTLENRRLLPSEVLMTLLYLNQLIELSRMKINHRPFHALDERKEWIDLNYDFLDTYVYPDIFSETIKNLLSCFMMNFSPRTTKENIKISHEHRSSEEALIDKKDGGVNFRM